jgi:hypothetical protein
MRRMIGIIAAALTVGGCSFGQAKGAAEAGAAQFHQMLDAGRFHDIYAGTSDDFRRVTTEAEFGRLLQMIHERLGAVRQTSESDWRVNFSGGSDMVVLHYATQFASGRGSEEFVYRVSGGSARLAGYHLNSTDLLTGAAPPSGNSTSAKPTEGTAPQSTVRPAPVEPPKPPEPTVPSGGK